MIHILSGDPVLLEVQRCNRPGMLRGRPTWWRVCDVSASLTAEGPVLLDVLRAVGVVSPGLRQLEVQTLLDVDSRKVGN